MTRTTPGPDRESQWVVNDERRLRAKQQEQLELDEQYAMDWVATMRTLVAQELADQEFTEQRMDLLKRWEQARKRDQHNLHYKYDPRRRNPKLVARDIDRQLEAVRERGKRVNVALTSMKLDGRLAAARPVPEHSAARVRRDAIKETKISGRTPDRDLRRLFEVDADRRHLRSEPAVERDFTHVPQAVLDEILDTTTITDIFSSTDAQLLAALRASGRTENQAQAIVDVVNGN